MYEHFTLYSLENIRLTIYFHSNVKEVDNVNLDSAIQTIAK